MGRGICFWVLFVVIEEQKEITDDQIKSMEGFDWSEIEVLSFGGNKLTNETTR